MNSVILRGVGDPVQLETVDAILGKGKTRIKPVAPAVVLIDPRDGYNVGNVQRACSNWGVDQLYWTGDRVKTDFSQGERLPREERMKGWANVALINHDRPFDYLSNLKGEDGHAVRIVGCELLKGAQNLFHYEHPKDCIYVFGPEDGEIPAAIRPLCHEFIMAPSHHCMNLACCCNLVLAFRRYSLIQQGIESDKPVNEWLKEHRGAI